VPEENLDAVDDEQRLVRRARSGDRRAFERLVESHQHRLFTLAARELGSAADAEDAVQEALIRAWRALPRFRAEASFSTWLYRICLNAVADQRARRARGSGTPLEEVVEPADPRDRLVERELSSELQRALQALDETYRTPVLLYDVLGRSYGEIAEVLGVAEGTVKSRIFRGRAELARLLGTVAPVEESKE
jgi:RNA polymerase sigma-70 factor, ECF subfamily